MNMTNFGHVSIVFEYDMMCARVYRVKCFNFSNIRIRTDFYIKIRMGCKRPVSTNPSMVLRSHLLTMHQTIE